eukprot:641665-Amphidinium_carterae.1
MFEKSIGSNTMTASNLAAKNSFGASLSSAKAAAESAAMVYIVHAHEPEGFASAEDNAHVMVRSCY